MADTLKLETHHQPTLFNKDMLIGGLLGLLVPGGLVITAAAVAGAAADGPGHGGGGQTRAVKDAG